MIKMLKINPRMIILVEIRKVLPVSIYLSYGVAYIEILVNLQHYLIILLKWSVIATRNLFTWLSKYLTCSNVEISRNIIFVIMCYVSWIQSHIPAIDQ